MPADGQAAELFDPFVTDTPAKPATQTVMIADRHGHSANLRVRIDPGVQAQMNKMIAHREVEYESVAEMVRAFIGQGLTKIAQETGNFELTAKMKLQATLAAMAELEAQDEMQGVFIEGLRAKLRESDEAMKLEYIAIALDQRESMSEKWRMALDEVLYPYRALFEDE